MMIRKQHAKLVMATTRWALKHPVYGIVILRLGIYTNRTNVSKFCSFMSSMNSSILILVIQENKLLASVPCFQKICLLSTNDLCFLTITFRPSRSFFLFPFCFMFTKTIHPLASTRKTFLCTPTFLYMTNFFCIRIRTLSLYVNTVYIQTLFMFKDFFFRFFPHTPVVYTKVSLYTLVAHTHKNFFSHIICTHKILLYTFSFYIYKKLFSFLCIHRQDFRSQHFIFYHDFLFILFLGRRS